MKICADIIAKHENGKYAFIERLTFPRGLALIGGKQEDEMLSQTAIREGFEESGLCMVIEAVLGTYADVNRDPRGHSISTVFICRARGKSKDEHEKTKVIFLTKEEVLEMKNRFVFDHFQILQDYFRLCNP